MFANLAGLLPLISVASVLLVSVNTIGYFQGIGLHFLGLMDLSNIIYPLGFMFSGMMLVLLTLSLVHLTMGQRNVEEFDIWRFMKFSFVVIAALMATTVGLFNVSLEFYARLALLLSTSACSAATGFYT